MLAGSCFELKAFVGADEMLRACQLGDHRMAAGGNQDGLGSDRRLAVGEPHRVRVPEYGAVKDDAHAGLLQRPRIDAVQSIDLAPDIADQRRPVEAQALAGPAEIARIGKGVAIAAAIDEEFLRHAAADHAGAADAIFLGDGHLGAELCREPAGAHAAGAAADHEQVVVEIIHLMGSAAGVARRRPSPR